MRRLRALRPALAAALAAAAQICCAAAAGTALPANARSLSHGLMRKIVVYRPAAAPTGVVIVLSGEDGWRLGVTGMAQRLARRGALVAGVDTPALIRALNKTADRCEYPEGDIDNLSHFVQAYYRLPTYMPALLVGYSSGASLAYVSLAQSKAGTFAGAIALGFRPYLRTGKPTCPGDALKPGGHWAGSEMELLPGANLGAPLQVLQGEQDRTAAAVREFFAQTPGVRFIALPHTGHGFTRAARWVPQYLQVYDTLQRLQQTESLPLPPPALAGLPIREIPAKPGVKPQDSFAILISGDGGWSNLEEGLAERLGADGIAVVGVDSLRYFWTPRTPAGIAADTDRIIRYYLQRWNKKKVLLVGYSQGADVLPFLYNDLPAQTRRQVLLNALFGFGDRAVFAFRLRGRPPSLRTLPQIRKQLQDSSTLCIYGDGESDSVCLRLDPKRVQLAHFPGGHDAGADPQKIAQAIINAAGLGGGRADAVR